MLWRGRRQSDNIEDLRGRGGGLGGGFGGGPGRMRIPIGRTGGGGLSGILILVVLFFVLKACGIDPMAVLTGEDPTMGREEGGGTVTQQGQPAGSDETKQFVGTVLAETEDVWNGIFKAEGLQYQEPTLAMFEGTVAFGLRLRFLRFGSVLLPRRPQALSGHRLLRPARPPVRRRGRFRPGLCDRA